MKFNYNQYIDHPLVSVIVPTHNNEKTLDLCLKSVNNQSYPNIELIIVDNNSTDSTKKIAEKYGILYTSGPERSAQRNFGAKKANGKYLIFLDSDIELTQNVISECIEMTKKGYHVITFPEVISGEGFWANCRKLEAMCAIGDDALEAPRFYETNVFWEVGGFDIDLTGTEDWDLRDKILIKKYKIFHINSLTIHHEGYVNPIRRMRSKYYYGKTMYKYLQKNKMGTIKQAPFIRLVHSKKSKELLKNPILLIGITFMKGLESIAIASALFNSIILKKIRF